MRVPADDRPADGADGGDLLENPAPLSAVWTERWAALRPGQRRAAGAVVAVAIAGALAAYGVSEVRARAAERALDDEVLVSASIGVSATSSSPPGGRVDFYVTVENTGSRPVSVTGVDLTSSMLRITDAGIRVRTIAPGNDVLVPVSVILDCTARPADGGAESLTGLVEGVPASGRSHRVPVTVADAGIVTSIAETVCRVRPEATGLELDGPVL